MEYTTLKNQLKSLSTGKYLKVKKNGIINQNYFENKLIWYFLSISELPAVWNYLFPTENFPIIELPETLIENLFNIPTKPKSYNRILVQIIIISVIIEKYLGTIKHHTHDNFSIIKEIENGPFTALQLHKWQGTTHNVALYLFIQNIYDTRLQLTHIKENFKNKGYIEYKLSKDYPGYYWNREN